MVTHIVFFELQEENKAQNIVKIKAMLEALVAKIAPLKSMEVGVDFDRSARAMDMSLISTFEDKAGLAAYATHPDHLEVVSFIKSVALSTKVVDYEH